ncbi:hypothetical protein Tco_0391152 [Tanacetum coccineum]
MVNGRDPSLFAAVEHLRHVNTTSICEIQTYGKGIGAHGDKDLNLPMAALKLGGAAKHLARRSSAEGGDSEMRGDGCVLVVGNSLSTPPYEKALGDQGRIDSSKLCRSDDGTVLVQLLHSIAFVSQLRKQGQQRGTAEESGQS